MNRQIEITFSHSRSVVFDQILAIAREAPGYREAPEGKRIRATVAYERTPADRAGQGMNGA